MNCKHDGNMQQVEFIEHGCIHCWKERAENLTEHNIILQAQVERLIAGRDAEIVLKEKAEVALKNATEISDKYEDRWLAEKQLREKAEARCAEMREAFLSFVGHSGYQIDMYLHQQFPATEGNMALNSWLDGMAKACASDCGKDYVPRSELDKRDAVIAEMRGLLSVSRCPNCDGQGWFVVQGKNGEPEQAQCQWCSERNRVAESTDCGKGWVSKEELFDRMLQWRGIDRQEDACPQCQGAGVFMYGSTAMWRGGIGGQMMTLGICSKCWGSGRKDRPWVNPDKLSGLERKLSAAVEALEKVRDLCQVTGATFEDQSFNATEIARETIVKIKE